MILSVCVNDVCIKCCVCVCFNHCVCVPLSLAFGSLPCLAHSCHCDLKSTSCIDLSITEGGPRPLFRPRVLLKAPTLAEMEEMNLFEVCVCVCVIV